MAISPDQTQYHTRPFAGLGSVGSYQVAGAPFMTGSTITGGQEVEIKFPAVTRSITIINKDATRS